MQSVLCCVYVFMSRQYRQWWDIKMKKTVLTLKELSIEWQNGSGMSSMCSIFFIPKVVAAIQDPLHFPPVCNSLLMGLHVSSLSLSHASSIIIMSDSDLTLQPHYLPSRLLGSMTALLSMWSWCLVELGLNIYLTPHHWLSGYGQWLWLFKHWIWAVALPFQTPQFYFFPLAKWGWLPHRVVVTIKRNNVRMVTSAELELDKWQL